MAIAFTNLGSSANPDFSDNTNQTVYTNSSWTPPSSGLIVVYVQYRPSAAPIVHPTITGNSLTWTQIKTFDIGSISHTLAIYAANASGSATGVTTFTFSSTQTHCTASFFQVTGADLSGSVSAAFVQTPTNSGTTESSGSVTLASAGNSNNRPIVGFIHREEEATTPDGDWTELDDLSGAGPSRGVETQYRDDAFDTQATASWTTSSDWGAIAAEIKADPGGQKTISVSDGLTVGDNAIIFNLGDFNISETDGVTIGESITLGMNPLSPVQTSTSDGLTVGDSVSLQITQSDIVPTFIGKQETTHELWLCNQYGQRLTLLDNLITFEMVRVVNSVGSCSVILPGNFHDVIRDVIGLDYMLEFWRSPAGGAMYLEAVFFIRDVVYEEDSKGNDVIVLSGPDGNDLLDRRIVAYAAGTSQADRTNQADDMMKDVVRENLGSSATDADRDLTDLNFTVAGDTTSAPSITKAFAWRNVLKVLQDIAAVSAENGTYLYFDIVPIVISSTEIGFEFRTYTDQPGQDRTYDSNNPILFSKEWGNLGDPILHYDYKKEANYVYGGGQGEGEYRTIVEVTDSTREGASVWNRREKFADARNETSTGGVTNKAEEVLRDNQPLHRFTGRLLDTPQTKYGIDWNFGDKVVISYRDIQFNGVAKALKLKIDKDGNEELDVKVEVIE